MFRFDRKGRALADWWLRRLLQLALALIACLFLALSLARLLDISVVDWPRFALWMIENYNEALLAIGRGIVYLVSNFPAWLFDVVTIYLLIGALVRISIRDIALESERSYYDRPVDMWDDEWHRKGIEAARNAGKIESARFYLLWPVRFISDVRGGYWRLTPLRAGIYFGIVVAVLVLLSLVRRLA